MVSLFLQHKTLKIQPIIILNIRIENKCLPTNRNKRYTNTVNVQTNKQIAFCFELIQRQMQNSFRFQWVFFFCIQISWVPSVEVKENNECLVWSFQHRTALKYILFWQKKNCPNVNINKITHTKTHLHRVIKDQSGSKKISRLDKTKKPYWIY